MTTFDELAASRRQWIADVLQPWCRTARRIDLIKAEAEWTNIAGKVDPQATLWTWAWGRFPALVHEGLPGLNETHRVRVALRSGETAEGFPDNRESERGQLLLITEDGGYSRPLGIDEIASVEVV